MAKLTTNEIDVLNGIAYHEMSRANSSKPSDITDTGTYCWVEDFSDTLSDNQVKGVVSSLIQKNLVRVDDQGDDHNTIDFTVEGFAAWQANDDDRASL